MSKPIPLDARKSPGYTVTNRRGETERIWQTPITVTSEYEAARIAESTPGAHVLVVRNDVLVSEFFGEA